MANEPTVVGLHPRQAERVTDDPDERALLTLTPRQKLYLDNRLMGMAPRQSALAAGYSVNSTKSLESHPSIQQLMLSTTRQALRKVTLDRQDVLQGFMDAVDAAATSTELVMAWREIGKVIGAYEPEVVVHKYEGITPEQLQNMSDEKLLEMAAMEDYRLPGTDIEDAEYEELSTEDEVPSAKDEAPADG